MSRPQLGKDVSHRLAVESWHLHPLKDGQVLTGDGRSPELDVRAQILEIPVESDVGWLHLNHVGAGAVAIGNKSGVEGGELRVELDLDSSTIHTSPQPMEDQQTETSPEN